MNKQITEDYVSFETAVLLNEKGFNNKFLKSSQICGRYAIKDFSFERCNWDTYITSYKKGDFIHFSSQKFSYSEITNKENTIIAPSQSLACKWLREVHGIHISVQPDYPSKTNYKLSWCWSVDILHNDCFECKNHQNYIDTFEQAAEAAIKYTLENLI